MDLQHSIVIIFVEMFREVFEAAYKPLEINFTPHVSSTVVCALFWWLVSA